MSESERRDERIGRALRDLDPHAALDDLSTERLVRRIAEAARSHRVPVARQSVGRLARTLAVLSVAASIAVVALVESSGRATDATSQTASSLASSSLAGVHIPEPGNLLAAAIGAESESDFLSHVTGTVDGESMLAASVRQ